MTKKDEIINMLIIELAKEVDYWLLASNRPARENEYGLVTYAKIEKRIENLRHHLLEAVFLLPGAGVKLKKHESKTTNRN